MVGYQDQQGNLELQVYGAPVACRYLGKLVRDVRQLVRQRLCCRTETVPDVSCDRNQRTIFL